MALTHGPHCPYSSYSVLGPAFSQPFLAEKCCFSDHAEQKQHFRPETAEEWLELTSYMSYMDDEGRGLPCPTTFSVRATHISRYTQPFLSRFWPKNTVFGPSTFGQKRLRDG